MKRAIFWLALLAAMTTTASSVQAQGARDMIGSQPTLTIATLDGSEFDLAAQRGKWVVLNYWATWCAPCIKEIPDLSALADRADVEVLGLDYEEVERDELDAFLDKHKPRYPIAPVDVYAPPEGWPAPRGLPLTYVVDPAGIVREAFVGPVTGADIDKVIAAGADD